MAKPNWVREVSIARGMEPFVGKVSRARTSVEAEAASLQRQCGILAAFSVSQVAVVPMCNQCQNVRATIFSEQTQELMCTAPCVTGRAAGSGWLRVPASMRPCAVKNHRDLGGSLRPLF